MLDMGYRLPLAWYSNVTNNSSTDIQCDAVSCLLLILYQYFPCTRGFRYFLLLIYENVISELQVGVAHVGSRTCKKRRYNSTPRASSFRPNARTPGHSRGSSRSQLDLGTDGENNNPHCVI